MVIKKQFLGAFGTNCPRELKLLPPSSRGDLPGPGSYDYQVSNQPPVSVYGNSVFTSRSHRIGLQRKDQISFPAPADYMIDHFRLVLSGLTISHSSDDSVREYLTKT